MLNELAARRTLNGALKLLPVNLSGIFDCMGIAEAEIAAAIKRRKQKRQELNATFSILFPSDILRTNYNTAIYRAHCRELLERVAHGEDTRPGTKAEALSMLCETSFKAPLTSAWGALYGQLFLEILPVKAREIFQGDTRWIHGEWPTQLAELLSECRRLARNEERNTAGIKKRKEKKQDGEKTTLQNAAGL